MLEAAAGTYTCGWAIASHAGSIVCSDMTWIMLVIGKAEAEKVSLTNMTFMLGDALVFFLRRTFSH